MTKVQQKEFVRALMKAIQKEIIEQITQGKVPQEWDGIELRALIEHHASEAACLIHEKEKHRRKQLREFKRVVLVNYL